jgi:hypothetical protein
MFKVVGDKITNHRGDVMAQKIRGKWETKEASVLEFIAGLDKPKKKTKKPVVEEQEVEVVRARDEDGKFIPDDPETPEVNEAWVARIKKKVTPKK